MAGKLFRSRKFLTMLLDVGVSLAAFFITKYAAPALADDMLFVIGTLQAPVLFVIGAWAVEDAAAKRAGNFPHS